MMDLILLISVSAVASLYMLFDVHVSISAAFFMSIFCIYLLVIRWAEFISLQKLALTWLAFGCGLIGAAFLIKQYYTPINVPFLAWAIVVVPPGMMMALSNRQKNEETGTDEEST